MMDPAKLEIVGEIAIVTLNRPEVLNAVDVTMARRLAEIIDMIETTPGIRIVIVRGSGRSFCAGGDIAEFAHNLDDMGSHIRELLGHLHRFLIALRTMERLVITCIQGTAAGAGFSLAFMGDFCVAADDAKFRPAYGNLGVSPDAGGTIGLVEAVGPRRALHLLLAETEFGARAAETMGLVTQLAAPADLENVTWTFALRLAQIPSQAAAATKALVRASRARDLETQLECEMEQLLQCMAGDAFRNQVRRFSQEGRSK